MPQNLEVTEVGTAGGYWERDGIAVEDEGELALLERLRQTGGAMFGPAWIAGVRPGMRLARVEGRRVRTEEEAKSALADAPQGGAVTLALFPEDAGYHRGPVKGTERIGPSPSEGFSGCSSFPKSKNPRKYFS